MPPPLSKSGTLAVMVIGMQAGSPRMPLSPALFRAGCTLSHPLQLNLFTKVASVKAYIQEDNGAVISTNNHNGSRKIKRKMIMPENPARFLSLMRWQRRES